MNITAPSNSQIQKSPLRAIAGGVFLIIATTIFIVLIGNILDRVPFIAALDKFVYETINLGPHPAWLTILASPFNFNFLPWGGTFISSFLYFVFALGFIYIAIFNGKNILYAILALILAVIVDAFLFKITHAYVFRDRPFVHLLNTVPEFSKAIWLSWSTYPSGHVRDMALYSSVIGGYAPKLNWLFIPITLWVSYCRIYLGAHYLTDVLAGLLLGYTVGWGILLIVKSWQQIMKNSQNNPRKLSDLTDNQDEKSH